MSHKVKSTKSGTQMKTATKGCTLAAYIDYVRPHQLLHLEGNFEIIEGCLTLQIVDHFMRKRTRSFEFEYTRLGEYLSI